ncbi:hypothetical protein AMTRI_Chr03g46630 [Amborella trichopoda]
MFYNKLCSTLLTTINPKVLPLPPHINPNLFSLSCLRDLHPIHSPRYLSVSPLMAQLLLGENNGCSLSNPLSFPSPHCCISNNCYSEKEEAGSLGVPRPLCINDGSTRSERAWAYWKKLGQPKFIVAPMVDNSELPFRMLCRKYGASAAYTPMLHSRIFSENGKYRRVEFTTCKLIGMYACRCPQRIAKRGNYGAFLMDNLPLVESLVKKLSLSLSVPVSCKIRIFPCLNDTLAYAKMLEDAGCSLLAVHGRTREQKESRSARADWNSIKAVKETLSIPVIANGNIRHLEDAHHCMEETGADGVLSAEALLENPAIFAGFRTGEWRGYGGKEGGLDQADLVLEYLKLCRKYPVPWRMVISHVHKMLGEWFRLHPDVREELNAQTNVTFEWLENMVQGLKGRGNRLRLYLHIPEGCQE